MRFCVLEWVYTSRMKNTQHQKDLFYERLYSIMEHQQERQDELHDRRHSDRVPPRNRRRGEAPPLSIRKSIRKKVSDYVRKKGDEYVRAKANKEKVKSLGAKIVGAGIEARKKVAKKPVVYAVQKTKSVAKSGKDMASRIVRKRDLFNRIK